MARWRYLSVTLSLAAALLLSGCKIVQISDQDTSVAAGFDAESFAGEVWEPQALPYFEQAARPVTEVLPAIEADLDAAGAQFGYRPGEGSPWSFVVSGNGSVIAKNTESRAGTLEVTVDGLARPVILQIGPVIRGNAVRDALPFVSFKDFVNQLEYANAGKALTALALSGFAAEAEGIAVGDAVSFTGTTGVSRQGDDVLVTPITLEKAP